METFPRKISYIRIKIMNSNSEIHREFKNVEEFTCPLRDEHLEEHAIKNGMF